MNSTAGNRLFYTKFCAVCGKHSKGAHRRMINRRTLTPRFCGKICLEKFYSCDCCGKPLGNGHIAILGQFLCRCDRCVFEGRRPAEQPEGSDFIDPRDEAPWSDSDTTREMMNSIKGR